MDTAAMLNAGIGNVAKAAGRFYLHNKTGRAFINSLIPTLQKAAKRRAEEKQQGVEVPPFLIASIATACNLHCAGCYARAGGGCSSTAPAEMPLSGWQSTFQQAEELGVSFVLLAGGEPLLRPDILQLAASFPALVFPVFTNATLLEGELLELFNSHRNLIPILSIEGDAAATDARRGEGVAGRVQTAMAEMQKRGMLFGASVTVTSENLSEVARRGYVEQLEKSGCGVVIYVEYVPVEQGTGHLMLSEAQTEQLLTAVNKRKREFKRMAVVAFPGDEAEMGGCLAAGRGFFHINASGGAEPCPFSPHAELSLQEHTMREVLASEYFARVRAITAQHTGPHMGGCTLYQHEDEVKDALATA